MDKIREQATKLEFIEPTFRAELQQIMDMNKQVLDMNAQLLKWIGNPLVVYNPDCTKSDTLQTNDD